MKNARLTYSVILLGGILWCGAIVLAPVLAGSPGIQGDISALLYVFFGRICHQIRARSFTINGIPFGVCSRCMAIYFGFLAGTLLYPFVRGVANQDLPSRRILILACIPMAVDVFPVRFGLYEATLATRAVSGGIVGIVLAFFIIPAAVRAVAELTSAPGLTLHKSRGISDATETR